MIEGAALVYSLMASFVLSSTHRNRKADRPHSRPLLYAGWLMMGSSFGGAAILGGLAIRQVLA